MKRAWWIALAGLLLACSDDDTKPDVGLEASVDMGHDVGSDVKVDVIPDAPPAKDPTVLITFNAGLVEGAVPYAKEREPLVIDALKQTTADVVCLQEVWTDASTTAVIDGVKSVYPYSFREKTEDTTAVKVRCPNIVAVGTLQACVTANCAGVTVSECVASTCKTQYDALSDECKMCLATSTANPTACALGGTRDFGFDGRNGLVLLSKYPLSDTKYTALDAQLFKRGVLSATVASTKVFCTHMSSDLGPVVPYPTGTTYASFEAEHAGEADAIVAAAPATGCAVLLGDLNCGPTTGGLTGELETNYAKFAAGGLTESWTGPKCTWCQENPLSGSKNDRWIDHIMFKGCTMTPTYTRVLDSEVTVTPTGGTATKVRLSDHYGLQVELK